MKMPKLTGCRRSFRAFKQARVKNPLQIATIVFLGLSPAFADQFPPSEIFNPKPAFDTTPVTVKVVSVTYRISRNYLILLEPAIPTLKLTWPGLKPLTEDTRKCFGSILQSEQAGCTSFDFLLLGSRGPAPGGRAFTSTERFENFMRGFDVKPKKGPFGYDVYEIGPEEARTEVYRKLKGDIYFRCSFSGAESRKRGGVCDDMFRLDDMNHVRFFFRLQQIEHIPEIEASIRKLMANFVTRGGSNDIDGVESFDSKRN